MKITPETTFDGLDAYQKVLDTGVDLVILATPPGFRPYHLEAAIKANKNIFCEKPVAVDATGARKCFGLAEEVEEEEHRHRRPAPSAATRRATSRRSRRSTTGPSATSSRPLLVERQHGIWFHDRAARPDRRRLPDSQLVPLPLGCAATTSSSSTSTTWT